GEDVGLALEPVPARRPAAHEREVGRAAADVSDQHLLLPLYGLLVVEGGGDRLVLQLDFAKARTRGGAAERSLGARVALGVVVDEVHRPAEHRARDRRSNGGLGLAAEVMK